MLSNSIKDKEVSELDLNKIYNYLLIRIQNLKAGGKTQQIFTDQNSNISKFS